MGAQYGLLYVAAYGGGPELNGLAPEKQTRGDILSFQEEGGTHEVECVTDSLQRIIMDIQEEVEDGQVSLDTGCLQGVISILAALVQVSSSLIHNDIYK